MGAAGVDAARWLAPAAAVATGKGAVIGTLGMFGRTGEVDGDTTGSDGVLMVSSRLTSKTTTSGGSGLWSLIGTGRAGIGALGVGLLGAEIAMGSTAVGGEFVGGLPTAATLGGDIGGTAVWIGGGRRSGAGAGGMAAAIACVWPDLFKLGAEIEPGDGLVR